MPEELLDEELIGKAEAAAPDRYTYVVPFLLLPGFAWCIYSGYIGDAKMWLAVTFWLTGTVALYLKWSKTGVLILAGGLFIACFGLIRFFPITFSFGISIGERTLSFDFIPFLVIILLDLTNPVTVKEIFSLIRKEKTEQRNEKQQARSNRFLIVFSKKSTKELESIVAERRLVPEAIKAAEELLEDRKLMAEKENT